MLPNYFLNIYVYNCRHGLLSTMVKKLRGQQSMQRLITGQSVRMSDCGFTGHLHKPSRHRELLKRGGRKKIEEPNKVIDTFNTSSQKPEEGRSL